LRSRGIAALACALVLASPVLARDYGQNGPLFPVVETDLLLAIERRLRSMEVSGEIDAFNRRLADRTAERVKRPPAVEGLSTASQTRSWDFDPSITLDQDIRDQKGRVLFARGTTVNPLDTVGMRRSLVFLDGDDPVQVAWALRSTTAENAHLILTSGNVFDRMKAGQRRFFFDQGGQLTRRFSIRHVPAVVQQEGRTLRVTELGPDRLRGPAKGRAG
jgi:conjugal transfer pilus assembly protein TraW